MFSSKAIHSVGGRSCGSWSCGVRCRTWAELGEGGASDGVAAIGSDGSGGVIPVKGSLVGLSGDRQIGSIGPLPTLSGHAARKAALFQDVKDNVGFCLYVRP
jgi:hypothetical protein